MGLKNFLKQQGFIEDGPEEKKPKQAGTTGSGSQMVTTVPPTYFPVYRDGPASTAPSAADPSFVTPLQPTAAAKEQPDANFIKFFEDALLKANLPGPDYFEFRQLLIKTQQKMAAKGGASAEVVLQAVLMSFEAQEITPAKLVEAAQHYKDVLKQVNDDFLKGAAGEKNNQLQKRQTVLQAHEENIKKIQEQLQQLALQQQQLEESMNKEKTQMEVDRTLGKEGIEKIEKAERLIASAHDYMQTAIDNDIKRLGNV